MFKVVKKTGTGRFSCKLYMTVPEGLNLKL
jgi:hypothetical protein